ncbi:MAG: MotA/TolQ/ExbB proton channel family protein [Verrucomicrobia bacterium]|nr:MotA/TolQ/ExbB proton channel family protein [Verrucomicrobiota bacterium]
MKFRHFIAAGFFLSASFVSAAATTAAATEPVSKQIDILEVLAKGGPMIYPLGVMSVIMVLLILVFLLSIRRNVIASDRFMNAAESMIRKRDYLGLLAYSQRRNECVARITQKTLEFVAGNPSIPFENVREAAQTEGSRQAGMLTARITYLADIGSLAPMVGLLGTVIGMIKAFIEISTGEVQGVRQMGLAQGVSEALIATACGLAISIVALSFYSFFRGRVQKYIGELEAAATHLVALLHGHFERQPIQSHGSRARDDQSMPVPSRLGADRHDIQGI